MTIDREKELNDKLSILNISKIMNEDSNTPTYKSKYLSKNRKKAIKLLANSLS